MACVPVWVYVHGVCACGGQKEEWESLVLELKAVRAACCGYPGLNSGLLQERHGVVSPDPLAPP